MLSSTPTRAFALTMILFSFAACGLFQGCRQPPPPLAIAAVDTGTSVDEENRVVVSSQTFSPQDTVYGSIKTEGAGEGTLAVSWVRQGQALDKQTQIINATKPTWFAFHFIPPGGWPKGTF